MPIVLPAPNIQRSTTLIEYSPPDLGIRKTGPTLPQEPAGAGMIVNDWEITGVPIPWRE